MIGKMDPVVFPTLLRSLVDKKHPMTLMLVHWCISTLSDFLGLSSSGDYEISVKFNDQHIPDSPYLVPVVAPANDARRLTVTGLQVRHEETPPHPALPCLAKGHEGHSCIKRISLPCFIGFLQSH